MTFSGSVVRKTDLFQLDAEIKKKKKEEYLTPAKKIFKKNFLFPLSECLVVQHTDVVCIDKLIGGGGQCVAEHPSEAAGGRGGALW